MNRNNSGHGEGPQVPALRSTSPMFVQRQPGQAAHSRRMSAFGEMGMIPESGEIASRFTTPRREVESSFLVQPEPSQRATSPSLFRRITTRLSTRRAPSPALLTSSMPLTSLRSARDSRYENIHDQDEDQENIAVDLSLLEGLGFQITEPREARPSPPVEQDTAYYSPRANDAKPDFQSFVRRRHVGDGLVVGAQLTRDPSVHSEENTVAKSESLKRNKTVRNAAQNFAESRNMIVAVEDLSFLEGPVLPRNTTQSFDTFVNRAGTMGTLPQSYFFPHDPDIPNWRPFTMSTIFILFLATGAFALAGSQEYLYQKSLKRLEQHRGLLSFDQVSSVSIGAFFVWKYLPTMITIIYAVLFSVMDFDIRRLEPFYQLSQPEGSPASESLNVDLLTMFQYFVPFKALRLRQWTVFFSTIGNIIASTASPALQNPSVNFTDNPYCELKSESDALCENNVRRYVVIISPIWSRLLSASYIVLGLICVILLFQLRRKSGLLSDPKGIAGIASMATKSHILREFKGTDLATRRDIQKRLAHRRFILYKSSIWQGQWNPEDNPEYQSTGNMTSPHPPMLRLGYGIPFITAQIFCLVAVPVISLTKANIIPNAAPWLPILIATILKLVWSTFEADVRLMEPFYQLSKGNASPENSLTLDYQATIYGFMPFKAAFNGHWLLCIVGVCSVALDVLSVTVSSFSVQANIFINGLRTHKDGDTSVQDETKISFWVSVILSISILTFVIFTTALVYRLRRHPFLPREPSTIASVLAFIYASNMLEDFIDTEKFTNKQMERKLKEIGKKYALGWFKGRDGQMHCAIDEEPMRSRYVHGISYDRALARPADFHGGMYP